MSLFRIGERMWIKQRNASAPDQWVRAVIIQVHRTPGPLGVPVSAYTLRQGTKLYSFYEMTLRNFKWLHAQNQARHQRRL